PAREPRDQRPESRDRDEHGDRRPRPEPGQILQIAPYPELVPERPQEVVPEEEAVEVRGRPEQGGPLAGSEKDQPAEQSQWNAPGGLRPRRGRLGVHGTCFMAASAFCSRGPLSAD